MKSFDLTMTAEGDSLATDKIGSDLLQSPLLNKGTGFTLEERRRLEIEGRLPAQHNDIDKQAARIYKSIFFNEDPVGRNIGLAALQDRNEVLFYKVLSEHLEETMPIVYTPTVGKASEYYSRVFRSARGIFITPEHTGRIEEVLRGAARYSGVQLMVVTDNESILGIGDQGAGGMAISIGKLALYCVGAGIHPARTLPISLDVGTNNEALLADPFYLGWRNERLRGDAYVAFVDEFVSAARCVFPDVVIQWEDFRKDNALMILDRYRETVPSFNDDIQGTGAVAAAGVCAGAKISGDALAASRILIYGAGAAGLGIARQLEVQLRVAGLSGEALRRSILVMDSRGVISADRGGLDDYKRELAWPAEMAAELGLSDDSAKELLYVVRAYKPTVLIGASGQGASFTEDIVRAMHSNVQNPVIMPMSNPTSISEAVPADIFAWTDGQALVATGSPFDPVEFDGELRRVGQANNVFVFPGIGLGTIVSGASTITDQMISAAATSLASCLDQSDIDCRCLKPEVTRLWEICGTVAAAVAKQAIDDGVSAKLKPEDVESAVSQQRWRPRYPTLVSRDS
jgi:malate dehydrogenase (oxaloacetate-decarboxylating)